MKSFADIYDRAAARKGGEAELKKLIEADTKTPEQLAAIADDRYLSMLTKSVFQAGFIWRVIENKWDGFEEAFWNFNVMRCAHISEDDIDALAQDTRIVRNRQKIIPVRDNAVMVYELSAKYGSFGKMLGDWPDEDYIGLLNLLKKRGSRLGGMSTQYFLRRMGKNGFVLSRDGVAALIDAGVIDKSPTSKTGQRQVQAIYNQWAEETGLSFTHISRILACSIDAV